VRGVEEKGEGKEKEMERGKRGRERDRRVDKEIGV